MFNVLNRSLHDAVFTTFLINLITFFCNLKIFLLPLPVYIQSLIEEFTVKPGYNNISLNDILYIASNIMSSHFIPNISYSSVRMTLIYNDTNYSVPFSML